MRKEYYSKKWQRGSWIVPPFIKTLPPWMENPCEDMSMSSRGDSPAKTCPNKGDASESTERDLDFGENTLGSLARFNQDSSSWRTSQGYLFGEWEEYAETWPASGTIVNGVLFQRPLWVRRIVENESGLWRTPTKRDSSGCTANCNFQSREKQFRKLTEGQTVHGSIYPHPNFVEALMGYPIGYSVWKPWETLCSLRLQPSSEEE